MKTLGLILAAGKSRRFGPENKLLCEIAGRPMLGHVAETLRNVQFDGYAAVISDEVASLYLDGFELLRPSKEQTSQIHSLLLGARYAHNAGFDRLLVVLGDMPFVTARTVKRILEIAGSDNTAAASNGLTALPPACFPKSLFSRYCETTAIEIPTLQSRVKNLGYQYLYTAPKSELEDIDTPEDMIRLKCN